MMRLFAIVVLCALIAGCSSEPSGPTYAEAVATYQAEVALLDSLRGDMARLEAERAKEVDRLKKLCGPLLSDFELDSYARSVANMSQERLAEIIGREHKREALPMYECTLAAQQRTHNFKAIAIGKELSIQHGRVQSAKANVDLLAR